MRSLINDLLAFSRSVNSEKQFETTDLQDIVAEVLSDFSEDIEKIGAAVTLSVTHSSVVIPFQSRQMIYNLVSNSVKFAHAERPLAINMETRAADIKESSRFFPESEKDYLVSTFADNGIGFDQKYSGRIFSCSKACTNAHNMKSPDWDWPSSRKL